MVFGWRDRRPSREERPLATKKRIRQHALSQREAEPMVLLWAVQSPFGLKREALNFGLADCFALCACE
jgi:hypothetical protein